MAPLQPFLYHPLTEEERNKKLAGVDVKSYDSFNSRDGRENSMQ